MRGKGLALDGTGRDTFNELVLCTEEDDQLRQDGDEGQSKDLVPGETKLPEHAEAVQKANAFLRTELAKYPKVRINSPENAIPHILNLSVQDVKGTVFQRELNEEGVCVSVKSACSSDGLPSRAVFAVSRDRRNALSSWRVSLSHRTTEEDLRGFLAAFDRCYRGLTETK